MSETEPGLRTGVAFDLGQGEIVVEITGLGFWDMLSDAKARRLIDRDGVLTRTQARWLWQAMGQQGRPPTTMQLMTSWG